MGHRTGHQCIDGTESLDDVAGMVKGALAHMIPHNPPRIVDFDTNEIHLAIEDDLGNDWIVTVQRPIKD